MRKNVSVESSNKSRSGEKWLIVKTISVERTGAVARANALMLHIHSATVIGAARRRDTGD